MLNDPRRSPHADVETASAAVFQKLGEAVF
jgi:hypothetical protein